MSAKPVVTYEEVAIDFSLPVIPATSEPFPNEESRYIEGDFLNKLRLVEELKDTDMGFDFGPAVEHVIRSELEVPDEMPSEGIDIGFIGYSTGFALWGYLQLPKGDNLTRLLQSFSAAHEVEVSAVVRTCLANYIGRTLGPGFSDE